MDRAVIGVDLGGTNLRTALIGPDGAVVEKRKEPTMVGEGLQGVLRRIEDSMNFLGRLGRDRGIRVIAAGVGAPGVIHADTGVVVTSPNFPDWNNLPLKQRLEEALGIPVFIENDANAAALGEFWRGSAKDVTSLIFLTLGTGVGGGIVLDGKIWHGADGMAGEIGHMTIMPDGRLCGCGNHGCLEMYASSRGIVLNYREELVQTSSLEPAGLTSAHVYESARNGETQALAAMKRMGVALGIGIANLINIFNPEMVVIGGGVKEAWPLFIDAARSEIRKRAFAYPAERTKIVPSVLSDDAGLVGAAAVALRGVQEMTGSMSVL